MIRKKNLYARPRKPFEKARIEEENVLRKKYGLKNKTEIWKTLAKLNYFRKRAMALANASKEEQEVFFGKLNDIDLNVKSISDVLDLEIENLLQRRLQTVVAKKGLANTIKQARQMVVHKKIILGNNVVNSPSYLVKVNEENNIKIKKKNVSHKQKEENKEASEIGVQNG